MLSSLRYFSGDELAQKRMEMISFYDQYGENATKQAFGADRKVISRWKKRLRDSGGKLAALVPTSTKPHQVRTPVTDPRIVAWIKTQRDSHPRIGKDKLKPDLDMFCRKEGIVPVSCSTIGNIIKRHHLFCQKGGKIYHDPAKWVRTGTHKKRLRIKHSPKPEYGHILSDTVEKIVDGTRYYLMSAIDTKMKFALTLLYRHITATNMKDFYGRFKTVYPGRIIRWQSDNGSENLGEFDRQLEEDGIPHLFIYPRCPKIDTFIERYNRTLQEEFVDYHLDIIHDPKLFNEKLVGWNLYYDCDRRHHSLGLKSPLQYLVDNEGMSQMSLTYTEN
jgi:transposase InsO family protein